MQDLVQGLPCRNNGARGPLGDQILLAGVNLSNLSYRFEGTFHAHNIQPQWFHWPHYWGTGAPVTKCCISFGGECILQETHPALGVKAYFLHSTCQMNGILFPDLMIRLQHFTQTTEISVNMSR